MHNDSKHTDPTGSGRPDGTSAAQATDESGATQVLPQAAIGSGTTWAGDPDPASPAGFDGEEPEEDFLAPDPGEPFVPSPRYVMGRSTRILVCVALVMAGALGGSALQKGVDAGTRSNRSNFSSFRNSGSTYSPGQGRGNGGNRTGGSGGSAVTPKGGPTQSSGQ